MYIYRHAQMYYVGERSMIFNIFIYASLVEEFNVHIKCVGASVHIY